MNQIPFNELQLIPEIKRAIEEMGFETATEIQSNSIPVIQEGCDVIGRSQTGTGKTIAFGIPALETIDPALKNAQVLILCQPGNWQCRRVKSCKSSPNSCRGSILRTFMAELPWTVKSPSCAPPISW